MKRVLSLALAVSLLGSTAAMAGGWNGPRHGGYHGGHYGWSHHGYHRGNNNAAAAVGLGIFALGALAIISSQNARREPAPVYYDRYDDRYGPPPAAYDNSYDGYGYAPDDDYGYDEDE